MRLDRARISPLTDAEATPEQASRLQLLVDRSGRAINIFRTLVRQPNAYDAFMAWGGFILSKRNPLPPRERELVVLRTGYLCGSGYEWTQHVPIGLATGLTEDEIARIKIVDDDPEWSQPDGALLRATDELVRDHFITDNTWTALGEAFSDEQRMAVVMTCGQYTQVSMMLNSFGVQLDEGQTLDPDLRR